MSWQETRVPEPLGLSLGHWVFLAVTASFGRKIPFWPLHRKEKILPKYLGPSLSLFPMDPGKDAFQGPSKLSEDRILGHMVDGQW